MSDTVPFTDADVARHRLLIDKRERAEAAARAENRRMERPRNLADWLSEGDECISPPIVDRPAKGNPLKEDEI
jgi:hypothetical protein